MEDIANIIYYINKDDVQEVAAEELGRELTEQEIALITDKIAENVDWYNAIANAIMDKIKKEQTDFHKETL